MKKYRLRFLITARIVVLFIFTIIISQCSSIDPKAEQEQKIQETISQMTLDQKAKLVVGTGMHFEMPDSIAEQFQRPPRPVTDSAYDDMVNRIRKNLPGAAGFTAEYPELGITTQVLADGPAGLRVSPRRKGEERTYYCTAFPIATMMASSWDTDLVYNVGKAMGEEVRAYNADVILGPGMNIQRDPLCGRNFEYYSEDPIVTGKMGAAMVNGVQSNGIGTSIKHFAANNQETNRMSVNTIVSERALREIYLRGFEIAVTEAQPWTVMSSYNIINGTYAPESHDLLTKILRDDWGFEGYVMTDWGGGSDAVAMMQAGNDLLMPGREEQIKEIVNAVNEGKLSESVLDKNISRILSVMMKSPKQGEFAPSNNPDLNAHAEVTRKAATEGMILLENKEEALPIPGDIKEIALFGTTSYEFISGGTGSGDVNEAYTISLLDGLKNGGLVVDEDLTETYLTYIEETRANMPRPKNWLAALMGGKEPVPEMEVSEELAGKMAKSSDIALITIGRNSGEGGDREAVEGDFYLTGAEKSLIKNVADAFQAQEKRAIVILNIGGAIETASWSDTPDAVLCAWQPGQEAGNSVVDVLTGKANPSGKLAITFPVNYEDGPSAKNFPGVAVESDKVDNTEDMSGFSFMRRVPWEVVYEEDIFVGYRYYNTFDVSVAYEFGYGLSYTDFEYSNLKLSTDEFKDNISVSIDVVNSGSVAGREVVQVYLSAPSTKLEKPSFELADFGKTKELAPGESQTLTFTIDPMDLCSFDEAATAWVAEAGTYKVLIGASSRKIKETVEFTLAEDRVEKVVTKALTPNREINKLSSKK